jgi:hypothetical protein
VTAQGPTREDVVVVVRSTLEELGLPYEETGPGAYLVRLEGQHKLATMTWLLVEDRTLLVEAFFMRKPDDERAAYRFLLERNARTYGVHFSVDRLGDIFLTGRVPFTAVSRDEVDRLLGCMLEYSDGSFDSALQLGFADAIAKEQAWRAKLAAQESEARRPAE